MTESEHTLHLGTFNSHGITRSVHQGRSVEVEQGIPGETVRARISGKRRLYGHIIDVLDPAQERIEPPCPYFREWQCGGCQWQHISYDGQIALKRQHIEAAMRSHNLSLPVTAVHSLPEPWRYRATAGIALGRRAGFRRHASLAIVPLRDCPISHPQIGKLMASLNDSLETQSIPDFRGRARLDVRAVDTPNGRQLLTLLRPNDGESPPPNGDVAALAEALQGMQDIAGFGAANGDSEVTHVFGEEFGTATVAGRPVYVAAASFFQTNLDLLPVLLRRVQEEARPLRGLRVADVYGGVGLFGLFLAEEADHVVVIESDRVAVQMGQKTAREWGLRTIEFQNADAGEALTAGERFDVVVVDPPRSGLDIGARRALAESRPDTVLYVSCLPQSLARDLRDLTEAGYRVDSLELFDFYPQTYHVETLAVLRRHGTPETPTSN